MLSDRPVIRRLNHRPCPFRLFSLLRAGFNLFLLLFQDFLYRYLLQTPLLSHHGLRECVFREPR